jgi:alkanesulfonate monooxygenase SsuD/methylene tetrahydromethanopterin reductase-like flavin-dependent oxidoreductase (luciferase family)
VDGAHCLRTDDQSPHQRYRDTIEQAVHAEALGFESVWPVEQHFFRAVSALPCPTLLLAAIAERTRRLRLGKGIERAWRDERCSFAGQFDTAVWAGRAGYPAIFAANIKPFPKLMPLVAAYRAARAEVGLAANDPDDVSVLMPVYVGESRAEVKRELEERAFRVHP